MAGNEGLLSPSPLAHSTLYSVGVITHEKLLPMSFSKQVKIDSLDTFIS